MQDPVSGPLEEKLTGQGFRTGKSEELRKDGRWLLLSTTACCCFTFSEIRVRISGTMCLRREETKIPDYDVSWQGIQTVHKVHLQTTENPSDLLQWRES